MAGYTARATRDGDRFWLVHVPEIDQWTQARRISEVEAMARDLVAVVRGVDPGEVELTVEITLPAEVTERLEHAAQLREQEAALRREAAEDVRVAAGALKQAGLSVREIGRVLGVSFQRAAQLTAP